MLSFDGSETGEHTPGPHGGNLKLAVCAPVIEIRTLSMPAERSTANALSSSVPPGTTCAPAVGLRSSMRGPPTRIETEVDAVLFRLSLAVTMIDTGSEMLSGIASR